MSGYHHQQHYQYQNQQQQQHPQHSQQQYQHHQPNPYSNDPYAQMQEAAAAQYHHHQQQQYDRQSSEAGSEVGYIYTTADAEAAAAMAADPYGNAGVATTATGLGVNPNPSPPPPGGGVVGGITQSVSSSSSVAGSGSKQDDEDDDEDDEEEVERNVGELDFDDPRIADLPRILLMGPRRGGKTSIQRVVFHKMSPHETLFRLEATQHLERAVVDHTPLCRFTIWDFPGDYYGPGPSSTMFSSSSGGVGVGGGSGNDAAAGVQGRGVDGYYGGTVDGMMGAGGGAVGGVGSGQVTYSGGGQHSGTASGVAAQNIHAPGTGVDATVSNQIPNDINNNEDNVNNGIENGEANNATSNADDGDAFVFGRATALIFVIDAQDEPYDHVLQNFTETVTRAVRANPHIAIEVFINKVDGELFLSDEAKYECRRDMMQQVSDELADAGVMPDAVPISYHLTSIYDHSVFEAFSRVVQKLIPQLPTLENLLNVLVSTCSMEKAYLFDVASKLYISTDSSPVDMQSVELCSDMIDVVLDVSGIYGLRKKDNSESNGGKSNNATGGTTGAVGGGDVASSLANTNEIASLSSDHNPPEKVMESITTASADGTGDLSNLITGGDLMSSEGGGADGAEGTDELVGTLISQQAGGGIVGPDDEGEEEEEADADTAYDSESSSVIRLSNGMVLYLKEVDTMLALVCLTRLENFRKKSLINYNIGCLKKALRALVQPSAIENGDS